MNLIFCKLKKPQNTWIWSFASLKKLKKHDFYLLQAKKALKTWISFLQAKKLKAHEFDFFFGNLEQLEKNMNFIFCKPKKLKAQ